MHIVLEAVVLSAIFTLYWTNQKRRRHLHKRIGKKAILNLYKTGRNLSFMLRRKELKLKGDSRFFPNGAILYSFHYGVWELMPQTLKKLGFDLGIIVNRYYDVNKKWITKLVDSLLYHFRSYSNIRIFYKEETQSIVKFIKNGGILGILVDGDTFYAKYEKAKKLAKLCGVPLIPFAAYRENTTGILELGCNLDALLKKRPLDYVWAYKSRNNQGTVTP